MSGIGKNMVNVLDKFTPTYDLERFKASDYEITSTAICGAGELGLNRRGIAEVVAMMTREHFYKSMTSYSDHKIWQDVYHVPYGDKRIYVKFTKGVIADFRLLSFKEK